MSFKGRILWRKHLSTADAQIATLFLTLSRRIGLPQPPAPQTRSVPALSSGRFHPERLYHPRLEVLVQVDVDGLMGPLGPQWDSPPCSPPVLLPYPAHIDNFWTHSCTPWSRPLPSEFQFVDGEANFVILFLSTEIKDRFYVHKELSSDFYEEFFYLQKGDIYRAGEVSFEMVLPHQISPVC